MSNTKPLNPSKSDFDCWVPTVSTKPTSFEELKDGQSYIRKLSNFLNKGYSTELAITKSRIKFHEEEATKARHDLAVLDLLYEVGLEQEKNLPPLVYAYFDDLDRAKKKAFIKSKMDALQAKMDELDGVEDGED